MPKSAEERILANLIKHDLRVEQDPLTPLVDTYLLHRDKSPERLRDYQIDMSQRPRPGGRLSPSKICGCERQAAFVFLGMPGRNMKDPEQELVFDDGNWRHHRWQATFLDMEKVLTWHFGKKVFRTLAIEEYVEIPELFIAGSLDVLVAIKGEKWVIDIKGINSWGFERVFKDHEPHEAHVLQLICYMRARRIPRGLLLYDHKDKNRTKIFAVRFDSKKWKEVTDWCDSILRKLNRLQLPPMSLECQGGNFLFERCAFSHICYGRKTPAQIKKRMYRDFDDLEAMWERGREIVLAHNQDLVSDDI